MTAIPLVDLAAQHAAVARKVAEGWQQVLDRTAFTAGPQVAAFESEYAAFTGTRHCVGVGNGTDAIEIALRALGIGRGDRVATFAWNSIRHLELYLAVPSMGAVLHTLNIRLFEEDLHYIVGHAEDKVIFLDASDEVLMRRYSETRRPHPMAGGGRTVAQAIRHERQALAELRDLYAAALGHPVSATNLQRVLLRRRLLEDTGERRHYGGGGGRPATIYRFRGGGLEITDQFAVLRPPTG